MSDALKLVLDRDTVAPRGRLEGQLRTRGAVMLNVELALVWVTSGKGDTDRGREVLGTLRVRPGDEVPFSFTVPEGPYSFAGSLISLQWSLHATTSDGAEAAVVPVVLSPGHAMLQLPRREPDPEPAKPWWQRWSWCP